MSGFTLGPAVLFCPADRPDRYAKALERADAVILDLEDAVAPDAKPAAREAVAASDLDPARVIVRVNPAGTADFDADVAALRGTAYRTVMLAKAESAAQCEALRSYDVIALCETAAGVLRAPEIAAATNVVALAWGAEDLVASLGGSSSRYDDQRYRDVPRYARSAVALAAGAFRKAALDAVHLDIADAAGLRAEAADGSALGFAGALCIHPTQVDVIRAAYRPSAADIEWAHGVLAAAAHRGTGVFTYAGRMIDEPLLRHARTILTRTQQSKETP